jgi:hypothetical protein
MREAAAEAMRVMPIDNRVGIDPGQIIINGFSVVYDVQPVTNAERAATIRSLPLPSVAEAASPSAGWRPIDTAPKDGTHILARGVRGEVSPPTTVHWFGPPDLPGLRAGGWYISVQQDEGPKVHPTHWMPLPAPSEEARAG